MTATILHIQDRFREHVVSIASLNDFTYQEGEAISPQVIIEQANISLYCLDDENRRAIFVELPPDIDLTKIPFCYQAQFDHARRLIAVSYETLEQLADTIPHTIDNLILIYSVGRCGSTLLSQIFNELDSVYSVSEPDVFTQFVHLREPDHRRDAELTRLLRTCTRLFFQMESPDYAIKFRNQCVSIIDLFQNAFPQAKNLFLYRNTIDWSASFYRLITRNGPPPDHSISEALAWFADYHNLSPVFLSQYQAYIADDATHVTLIERLTLLWLILMDIYLIFQDQGIPILVTRYEDLNENRQQTLTAIFDYCNLPLSQLSKALTAFSRDSQEGSRLARADAKQGNTSGLTNTQIARIQAILQKHPTIQTPDFIAPGTLAP